MLSCGSCSADTATAKERRHAADASCVRTRAALFTTTKQMEVAKADSIRLLHQRSSLANEVEDAKQALQQAVCATLPFGQLRYKVH